ncbi:MAG: protein-export chaperone SecB [Gammaproteobacteria bacterium]|nr:MAG: protein-export chaperone SecB [Gammaproteobacteria bacterium]
MTEDKPATGNGNGQGAGEPAQQQFLLRQLYIKDLSFEAPNAPGIFTMDPASEPEVQLNLKNSHTALGDDLHEVVLHISIDAKLGDRVMFLVELDQAGVFLLRGYRGEDLQRLLGIHCPSTLFPYAREAVSSIVAKGGFPPIVLQPISFEALYAQAGEQGRSANA